MAPTNYPYLDLTVLPEIRPHVITSRAVMLYDDGFTTVLWANGEGTSLLGSPVLRDLLNSKLSLNAAMSRQISSAIEQLDDHDEVSAVVRIGRVLRSHLLGFNVQRIKLPGGETAVLMVTEELHGRSHTEQDMARTAVDCLDGYSHASAILTANGDLVATSEHFSALEVSPGELANLAREVSTEDDRLVKRLIATTNGSLAAGIARLSDDPASHILIIADTDEIEETAPAAAAAATASATEADANAAPGQDAGNGDEDGANLADAGNGNSEGATAPTVGAFSNRRGAGLGRWYYKQPKEASADDAGPKEAQAVETEDQTVVSEVRDSPDATTTPADHAGIAEAEDAPSEAVNSSSITEPEIHGEQTSQPETEDAAETSLEDTATTAAVTAAAAAAASGGSTSSARESLEKSGLIQETSFSDSSDDTAETDTTAADPGDDTQTSADAPSDIANDEGFEFTVGPKPIRFVWDMDTNNQFRSVSDELVSAVGPNSADLVGRTWTDLCKELEIDNGDEVTALLNEGDTWSGKTVFWPVESTDLRVPIDLAGLPSYGTNRAFEGFNGFGIVRTADAVVDPRATGLSFGRTDSDPASDDENDGDADIVEETDIDSGSTDELANAASTEETTTEASKIVNLDQRRESKADRALSSDEQETFEEIGEKLADEATQKTEDTNSDSTEAKTLGDKKPADAFIPSAFSGLSRKTLSPTQDDTPATVGTPEHNVDTSILARLPIPVLVYRANDLLFGNAQFFEHTGYADLAQLVAAGGIDALFGKTETTDGDTQSAIYHANGDQLDVRANLQRVPWDDDRAMLLTLRNGGDNDGGGEGGGSNDGGVRDNNNNDDGGNSDGSTSGQTSGSPPSTDGPAARLAKIVPLHKTDTKPAFDGLGAEDLRNILDTATDGVVILSDEGIVRALNKSAEALFDVEPDAILDQSFTKILAPESHRSAMDYLSGMSGTGVASLMNDGREVIGKTAKGGLIPLFMTIGKLEQTNACCAVTRDITQWKKAEEELLSAKSIAETASAQKTEFLAKVSHEIRTPLNAIIGFSDMMIEERFGKIDNDRYRGYLRDIHRSGNHVLELVNDLLDISKIEAGKMELEFDACDLNTTVSETVALTQPDANRERMIIRTSLSAVVPKVVADSRSLRQIILNLVSNSIKYTKPGGQIIVSTIYEESGEVVLRVRDTGIGMSEMELARALKPFQQINAESNTQGTGLGLPLTKAMVEANRARFEIDSKPEEGTLVEIFFPSQRVLADR